MTNPAVGLRVWPRGQHFRGELRRHGFSSPRGGLAVNPWTLDALSGEGLDAQVSGVLGVLRRIGSSELEASDLFIGVFGGDPPREVSIDAELWSAIAASRSSVTLDLYPPEDPSGRQEDGSLKRCSIAAVLPWRADVVPTDAPAVGWGPLTVSDGRARTESREVHANPEDRLARVLKWLDQNQLPSASLQLSYAATDGQGGIHLDPWTVLLLARLECRLSVALVPPSEVLHLSSVHRR